MLQSTPSGSCAGSWGLLTAGSTPGGVRPKRELNALPGVAGFGSGIREQRHTASRRANATPAFLLVGQGSSWLSIFAPPVSAIFDELEEFLDKLNGYRHFGDLRYLSDVAEGRFDTVRLLSSPPAIDRITWMSKRLAKSIFVPVKSHSMSIYRRKLLHIANDPNNS